MKQSFLLLLLIIGLQHVYAGSSYTFTVSNNSYTELTGATDLTYVATDAGFYYTTNFKFPVFGRTTDFNQLTTPKNSNGLFIDPKGYMAVYEAPALNNTVAFQLFYHNYFFYDAAITKVSAKIEGTTGNRILKIQWKNVVYNNDASKTLNYQAWLYESNGNIEYRFGPTTITGTLPGAFTGIIVLNPDFSKLEDAYNLTGNPASPIAVPNTPNFAGLPPLSALPANGTTYTFAATTTGVNNVTANEHTLDIYPNPAKGSMNIAATTNENITMYNAIGQAVMHIIVAKDKINTIDLSNVARGMHVLRTATGQAQIIMVE